MRERTFWAELALVQIAAAGEIVLLDAPELDDSPALGKMLAERRLVLHACSEDLEVLAHTTGIAPTHIEDTQLAAAMAGYPFQMSYQKLVAEVCGVELGKEVTRSDWLKRPLTDKQLMYAADDVRYLAEVRQHLTDRLDKLGRLSWWQEECQRQLDKSRKVTAPEDSWKQVKGAGRIQGQALARLQLLAAWRDQQAVQSNRPKSFILKNDLLLQLSQTTPTNCADLVATGLPKGLVRRQGDSLLQLLQQANNAVPPAPLPSTLDGKQRQQVKKMKKRAADIAERMGVEVQLLVRRRWLEALARNPANPPQEMMGWREAVVLKELSC